MSFASTSPRKCLALALAVVLTAFAVTSTASAQRRSPSPRPACNITAMPFVQGTEWRFEATAPPVQPTGPVAKPKQPAVVTIKVVSITTEGAVSEIVLEETADERKYTSRLSCSRDALYVPPQSFLFSGEPGGGLLITLGEVTRGEDSAPSYRFHLGRMRIPEWIENLEVSFKREPTEGTEVLAIDGKLDLQRIVMIGLPEPVTTKMGTIDATPVQVDLRGSVVLNLKPEAKEFNIPANTISKLWFAENMGPVQVFNTNGHLYQLVEIIKPE